MLQCQYDKVAAVNGDSVNGDSRLCGRWPGESVFLLF
jgi:hypothetical protein